MYQRRYDKVYLMLRQEAAGYGLGSRAPWGSCVMELKNGTGRLTMQVQGLRPLPQAQYEGYVLLENPKGEQTAVYCAALQLDAQGSGKMEWDFSPDHITGGYQAEDLFAALITTTTQGKRIAPLAAYFGARREWRSCFVQNHAAGAAEVTNLEDLEKKDIYAAEALSTATKSTKSLFEETAKNVISFSAEAAQQTPYKRKPPVEKDTAEQQAQVSEPQETKEKTAIQQVQKIQKIEEAQEIHEVHEVQKNPKAAESYHGNFRGLLQKFRDEMTQLQEMGILSEEESQRILGTKTAPSPVLQSVSEQTTESEKEVPQENQKQDLFDMQAAESGIQQTEQNTNTRNTEQTQPTQPTQPTQQTEQERTQSRANALQQRTEPIQTEQTEQTESTERSQTKETVQENPETQKNNTDWEILFQNEVLTPFADGAPWYCISLGELVLLPQAPLAWQKNPFFLLSYAKYGHLILQRQEDGFLLGLPDTYESSARRRAQQLGFATFVRLPQQDTLGYWIGRL